jgi:histidine triad (HIT) family protein
MENCIFCKIASGQIPSHKIWENQDFMAFLDIYPAVPGATVVIPKKHANSYIKNVDEEMVAKIMEAVREVMEILDSRLENNLRTKLVFEGLEVDHLHAKLWPMYRGIEERIPQEQASEEDLEEIAEKLRG